MRSCVHHGMRLLRAFALPLALVLSSAPLTAQSALREHIDRDRLRTSTDSFVVMLRGKASGWQRLRTTRLRDGWQLSDAITLDTIVTQESVSTLDANLDERSLRQEGLMMGKPMKIVLDWAAGRVKGSSMTPTAGPAGTLHFDTVAVAGAVDDNAVTPLLAAVRWRDSLDVTFPVFSSGRGTTTNHRITVTGTEAITVPAGQFDTWRIEMRADRSLMIANVTRTAPYRLVRMQNGRAFEVLLLK